MNSTFKALGFVVFALAPTGALFAGGSGLASMGCASSYDPAQTTKVLAPDYDLYATYLDSFVNRRCGTLDCHGATGRAFRHYGNLGLRRLEGRVDELGSDASVKDGGQKRSGVGATTPDEVRANYAGIIALEPEVLSRIVALNGSGEDVDNKVLNWMFLRKALGRTAGTTVETGGERHKGGNVLVKRDPGYNCIVLWLKAPRKPASWKAAGASAGEAGVSAGSRAAPATPEEKEYADYLTVFDRECTKNLEGFR
jgi:hypothetical protein